MFILTETLFLEEKKKTNWETKKFISRKFALSIILWNTLKFLLVPDQLKKEHVKWPNDMTSNNYKNSVKRLQIIRDTNYIRYWDFVNG